MDVNTLYHRTVEGWADRVNAVKEDQWGDPTPCREWTVRDLTNHVTYENLWTVPLMEGSTIEEVGDKFEGDVLGEDPIRAALTAARGAIDAVAPSLAGDYPESRRGGLGSVVQTVPGMLPPGTSPGVLLSVVRPVRRRTGGVGSDETTGSEDGR